MPTKPDQPALDGPEVTGRPAPGGSLRTWMDWASNLEPALEWSTPETHKDGGAYGWDEAKADLDALRTKLEEAERERDDFKEAEATRSEELDFALRSAANEDEALRLELAKAEAALAAERAAHDETRRERDAKYVKREDVDNLLDAMVDWQKLLDKHGAPASDEHNILANPVRRLEAMTKLMVEERDAAQAAQRAAEARAAEAEAAHTEAMRESNRMRAAIVHAAATLLRQRPWDDTPADHSADELLRAAAVSLTKIAENGEAALTTYIQGLPDGDPAIGGRLTAAFAEGARRGAGGCGYRIDSEAIEDLMEDARRARTTKPTTDDGGADA